MGLEVWILIVLVASAASAWTGARLARRGAPTQAEMDALAAELDAAQQQAEAVQSNVGEHFEQSAVLFGKLAKDYREFLQHFESSAQTLGLSETRARELLEQGYQPLLTHVDVDVDADVDAEVNVEVVEEADEQVVETEPGVLETDSDSTPPDPLTEVGNTAEAEDSSQLEESQLEESQLEESQLEESQLEESEVEKPAEAESAAEVVEVDMPPESSTDETEDQRARS